MTPPPPAFGGRDGVGVRPCGEGARAPECIGSAVYGPVGCTCPTCGALPCDQVNAPFDTETRFWSIVDSSGLAAVPSDMWAALEVIVRKAGHYDKLVRALHDAICSPKGVVPDSADPYYRSSLCHLAPPTPQPGDGDE